MTGYPLSRRRFATSVISASGPLKTRVEKHHKSLRPTALLKDSGQVGHEYISGVAEIAEVRANLGLIDGAQAVLASLDSAYYQVGVTARIHAAHARRGDRN